MFRLEPQTEEPDAGKSQVRFCEERQPEGGVYLMTAYKRSRVLSVRIAADELEALAKQAATEGRSVSGQVAFFVRERVKAWQNPSRKSQKISGWLRHLHVPETHEELQSGRRAASAKLLAAARSKARRATPK